MANMVWAKCKNTNGPASLPIRVLADKGLYMREVAYRFIERRETYRDVDGKGRLHFTYCYHIGEAYPPIDVFLDWLTDEGYAYEVVDSYIGKRIKWFKYANNRLYVRIYIQPH